MLFIVFLNIYFTLEDNKLVSELTYCAAVSFQNGKNIFWAFQNLQNNHIILYGSQTEIHYMNNSFYVALNVACSAPCACYCAASGFMSTLHQALSI